MIFTVLLLIIPVLAYILWSLITHRPKPKAKPKLKPKYEPEPEPHCEFLFRKKSSGEIQDGPLNNRTIFSWTVDTSDQRPKNFPGIPWEIKIPVKIEGSDHGVICLSDPKTATVYLWNPSICQLITIPPPNLPETPAAFCIGIGHVHDDLSDDGNFKVVMVSRTERNPPLHFPFRVESEVFTRTSRVSVYSHKAESWTTVDAPMPALFLPEDSPWIEFTKFWHHSDITCPGCPTVLEGALHWGLNHTSVIPNFPCSYEQNELENTYAIVAFNLCSETFTVMRAPVGFKKVLPHFVYSLVRAFGRLALVSIINEKYAEIWVMNEYGVDDSWTKSFTVDIYGLPERWQFSSAWMKPYGVVQDKYLILAYGTWLFWYDLAAGRVRSYYEDKRVGRLIVDYLPTNYSLRT